MAATTRVQELVGRDEEVDRIDSFLTRRGAGDGALVLEGEAGIGETTLWEAGVERAREYGFRVLVARPAEAERGLSFATLGDLLADVDALIGKPPPPQRRPLAGEVLLAETRGAPVDPRAIGVESSSSRSVRVRPDVPRRRLLRPAAARCSP